MIVLPVTVGELGCPTSYRGNPSVQRCDVQGRWGGISGVQKRACPSQITSRGCSANFRYGKLWKKMQVVDVCLWQKEVPDSESPRKEKADMVI